MDENRLLRLSSEIEKNSLPFTVGSSPVIFHSKYEYCKNYSSRTLTFKVNLGNNFSLKNDML